jgi:hypothetical protein
MERDSVNKTVDEIIVEMTSPEGASFPRNEMSVEVIMGWVPLELREEPVRSVAIERAELSGQSRKFLLPPK